MQITTRNDRYSDFEKALVLLDIVFERRNRSRLATLFRTNNTAGIRQLVISVSKGQRFSADVVNGVCIVLNVAMNLGTPRETDDYWLGQISHFAEQCADGTAVAMQSVANNLPVWLTTK